MHTLSDPGTDSRYVALKVQLKARGNLFQDYKTHQSWGHHKAGVPETRPWDCVQPVPATGQSLILVCGAA